jgi:ferredoxin-NADP reductase
MGRKPNAMTVRGVKNWLEAPAAGIAERGGKLNLLRGAVARVTTPLLPDGRVVDVRKETADSATLVIKPGWGFDFRYEPGQYIGIGILVEGRWHWRSYSLTSPPDWDDPRYGKKVIAITVKAMPEGFLSSHLVNGVSAGTIVRLAAPQGAFVLPSPPPPKVLFLTAGSGITPVMSMLRALDRRDAVTDVVHIHSARTAEDVIFAAELDALHARHPGFVSHIHLTGEKGKFATSALDELYPDWRERQAWACGPLGMLDEVEKHWQEAGLESALHVERFEVERSATTEGGTVTFGKSGRTVTVDGATTLLEAGESAGVQLPFGCRMGICQTCVVTLSSGHARDLRNGMERFEGEKVQTCISAAAGDCTLEV